METINYNIVGDTREKRVFTFNVEHLSTEEHEKFIKQVLESFSKKNRV